MPRPSERPMRKATIRLFEDQIERLRMLYPSIGYNVIIRALIEEHFNKLDRKLSKRLTEKEIANAR